MRGAPVRLGLLAASPVHYQAPLYRLLADDERIDFTAIFASNAGVRPYDGGYGRHVRFADDLLDGYRSVFLRRAETNPAGGGFADLRDWDIRSILTQERFDVLLLHGYHTATHLLAALTQRLIGGGVVFREEQTLLEPRPFAKRLVKRLTLPLHFRGGYAVYIGTENRRWWESWGTPEERLVFAPYAVDNGRLQAQAAELLPRRGEIRREFGIADDAGPVVLFVGRLIPKKDPLTLLEAFRRVRQSTRCTLLIAGAGPLEAALKKRIAAYGIPDVKFAGFLNQAELPRAYACGDVFALPSREGETWGLVVNEAMNFGLPVVASRKVGSATDLVRDGETGLLCESGDPSSLEASLRVLVERPALRQALGRAARELIGGWSHERARTGIVQAACRAAVTARIARHADEGADA